MKLLWHSNAPWTATGYGSQTNLFTPLLAEHYDVAISAFYGLEGAPIRYNGIPVFSGLGGDFGNDTLPQHATRFFGGDPKDGLVVTLCDVWPLEPEMGRKLNIACWTPVDHEPAPAKVYEWFIQSDAIPIAMSRFGERMLESLDPLYVPHGVDTSVYRPQDRETVRRGAFPKGAFVVGMVAANKGHPSRKAFSQALVAFSRFMEQHEDVCLYLHTVLDPNIGQGVNLPGLIRDLGIPLDRIKVADQYSLLHNPHSQEDMAQIFSALDVLLNPSFGEGFGVPILEAQACGIPAVVTDWTAMPEVCKAGWHVKHHPYWSALGSWQAIPDIDDIVAALEECYSLSEGQRAKLADEAREHALTYDVRRVAKEFFLPALQEVERRIEARNAPPVLIGRKRSVSIVTPWMNHPDFRWDYEAALGVAQPDEVLVIDNGSDPPIELAAHRFEENVGFSRACNKGLELATGEVVVFLNNDIRHVRADWLDMLVAKVASGVLVGAQLRNDAHAWVDGQPVPYLDGWCLAGMRDDFERIGAWCTEYTEPSYYGDNDLSVRAKAAGMRLVEVRIGLEHLVGGTSDEDPELRDRVTVANRRLFEERVRELRQAARRSVQGARPSYARLRVEA